MGTKTWVYWLVKRVASTQARQVGLVLTTSSQPQKISVSGHAVSLNETAPTAAQDLQQGSLSRGKR